MCRRRRGVGEKNDGGGDMEIVFLFLFSLAQATQSRRRGFYRGNQTHSLPSSVYHTRGCGAVEKENRVYSAPLTSDTPTRPRTSVNFRARAPTRICTARHIYIAYCIDVPAELAPRAIISRSGFQFTFARASADKRVSKIPINT